MIRYLIQKEFLQIRRNGFLPRLIIMFPIMIMCIMPWVMNQEVKNVRVDVVDIDHTTKSVPDWKTMKIRRASELLPPTDGSSSSSGNSAPLTSAAFRVSARRFPYAFPG